MVLPTHITAEQQAVLQAIFDSFRRRNRWPTFGLVDRPLRTAVGDPAVVIKQLPATLLVRSDRGEADPLHDDELRLTLLGISLCEGGDEDVNRFLAAVHWMADIEADFDPGENADAKPTITSAALATALALLPEDLVFVERMWFMLQVQRWGMGSGGGSPADWRFEVDRSIQRFARAQTAVQYADASEAWVQESIRPQPTTGASAGPTGDIITALIEAPQSKSRWSRGDKIALWSLAVAVAGVIIAVIAISPSTASCVLHVTSCPAPSASSSPSPTP